MVWLDIVAMLVMTLTNRLIDKTRPTGVDKASWRAKVKARIDAEDNWLVGEIKKHSG